MKKPRPTTTKSIQFINKPVFLFSFFPCCCFDFISKQQQQKNRHFIYDLSMLWLGIGKNLNMRGSNSELNPTDPGQWTTSPSRTVRSQIVFYQTPKFEDSWLKNGTDGRIRLVNSTKHVFFTNML
jgi:hypothetical protein